MTDSDLNIRFRSTCPRVARGFTLTEMLIVISLIVLVLALALPAFNFLSGGNSLEAATNVISAAAARSRQDALAVEKIRGIVIYLDPDTQRRTIAFVEDKSSSFADWNNASKYLPGDHVKYNGNYYVCHENAEAIQPGNIAYWQPLNTTNVDDCKKMGYPIIDVVADSDRVALPAGVDAYSAGDSFSDTGFVLFDGSGRLIYKRSGLFFQGVIGRAGGATGAGIVWPFSAPGFMLASAEAVKASIEGLVDADKKEKAKFDYLKENARPVLINRYNGTLIKGQ